MNFEDLRHLAARLVLVLRDGARFFFGTVLRTILSLTAISFATGYWLGNEFANGLQKVDEDLTSALKSASYFEKSVRELRRQLSVEQQLRKVAERSVRVLAENIREQDKTMLDVRQQLAFQSQILQEQGSLADEVDIRSFEINPDFRESSYRVATVLIRGVKPGVKEFAGRLDLVLSLADDKGNAREFRPVFEPGQLNVDFHHYLEVDLGFVILAGYEILNAQLVLFDASKQVVTSRVLHDPL